MPYDPGITYQGGQMWANALSSIGSSAADAIKEYQKAKEDQANNEGVFNYVVANQDPNSPLISLEDQTKFKNGNAATKNGIIASAARNMHMQIQQQDQLNQEREIAMKYREYNRKLDEANWTPPTRATPVYGPDGKTIIGSNVQVSKGSSQFIGTDQTPVTDAQGNVVAVRYGNKMFRLPTPPASAESQKVQVDETTGGRYTIDPKTGKKLWLPQGQQFTQPPPSPTPVPGPGMLERGAQAAGILPPVGATPAPSPAAATFGTAPAAPPAANAQAQAAAIKQQYQAGQITREQAVQQLQAIGYQ